MRSVLRRAVAVAALVGVSAVSAQAQMGGLKVEEIRLDLASIGLTGGTSIMGGIPGTVALGVYLNDKLAIEPQAMLAYLKPEGGGDATTILGIGVFAPFYLAGDRGHSGIFLSPGVSVSMFDAPIIGNTTNIDFGADIGYKGKMSDKVSWRAAATLRDGDSYGDAEIGGSFGFSLWWR